MRALSLLRAAADAADITMLMLKLMRQLPPLFRYASAIARRGKMRRWQRVDDAMRAMLLPPRYDARLLLLRYD